MKPHEEALKNRLKVAYHTTKQATSEVAYEKTIFLVKELGVNVGSTQLSRECCGNRRQIFADGMLEKKKDSANISRSMLKRIQ